MSTADDLRAALAVAELEEKLIAEKASSADGRATQETKYALRDAREQYRTKREAHPAGPGEARPATVNAKAKGN